jgi:hypothetical protein
MIEKDKNPSYQLKILLKEKKLKEWVNQKAKKNKNFNVRNKLRNLKIKVKTKKVIINVYFVGRKEKNLKW